MSSVGIGGDISLLEVGAFYGPGASSTWIAGLGMPDGVFDGIFLDNSSTDMCVICGVKVGSTIGL